MLNGAAFVNAIGRIVTNRDYRRPPHPMAQITLQVIDGADRGKVYGDLSTPVTIGREEGNSIQLNDERISRFHLKIQDDQSKLVLTDLESTNGTKVNGEDISLRILRYGDMISLGCSVLVFGSQSQIAERLASLRNDASPIDRTLSPEELESLPDDAAQDFVLNLEPPSEAEQTLHALVPPELPHGLSPGQAAQLSELLEYLHVHIRQMLEVVECDDEAEQVALDTTAWQKLIDLQAKLGRYLRLIGHPDEDSP